MTAASGSIVDTHCHLAGGDFVDDRAEAIARARAAGVERMLVIGDTVATSREAVALAHAEPGIFAAVGIHPHDASSGDAATLAEIAELATDSRVVAIGEIGLDYHYDYSPREQQHEVCTAQIELARRLGKPIVVHNREADADLMALLSRANATECGGVLHCFWSDAEVAAWAIDQGFYLGVGGPITFKNTGALRDVIAKQPLERLIIETDSPYLAPVPHRGKRNEPAFVAEVAAALAQLLDRPVAEIAAQTTANAERLFGLAS